MRRSSFVTWESIRVTAVIATAVLIVVISMVALGRSANLFTKRYELVTYLADANGLKLGGPVMVAGKLAGTIKRIDFLPVDEDTTRNLVLRLAIDSRVREQVRADSRGGVRTLGLLGDKVINIIPGTPSHRMLTDGDTLIVLPSLDYEALLAKAADAIDDAVALAADLRQVTSALVQGQGTIGQLLTNRSMYDQLNGTLVRANALLVRVQSSRGTFARFLDDPALYDQLVSSVASLDSLVVGLSNPDGTLGRLVNDTTVYANLVTLTSRFVGIAGAADTLVRMMSTGDGTASRLLTDSQLYDSLVKLVRDLSAAIADMQSDPRRYLRGVITIRPF